MATHSSVLAWRIPGTGEPGGLPSMGSHRVGHDWSDLAAAAELCYILRKILVEYIKFSKNVNYITFSSSLLLLLLSHFSHVRLCDPIDGSPPGSPVPGILQAKNAGVGCHFLLQCMKVKSESEVAQSCPTLCDSMDCSLLLVYMFINLSQHLKLTPLLKYSRKLWQNV